MHGFAGRVGQGGDAAFKRLVGVEVFYFTLGQPLACHFVNESFEILDERVEIGGSQCLA